MRSHEEAAELGLQVIPHLAHLRGQEQDSEGTKSQALAFILPTAELAGLQAA